MHSRGPDRDVRLFRALAVAGLLAGAYDHAVAAPVPARSYSQLRYEENWSFLRDATKRGDPWDAVKYIPLNREGDRFLSIGGEIRERYEYFSANNWGAGPQDRNGYVMQRYMLHTDWLLGEYGRAFVQFKSGIVNDRVGGPRATDQDQSDLGQAFLDLNAPWHDGGLTARVGRQEMSFGSSRLVAVRESPNVRQAFDGVRLIAKTGPWRLDVLGTRPAQTNPGIFDDHPDDKRTLWGLYGTRRLPSLGDVGADLYYFRYSNASARFDQGAALEVRHSVGTRLWGRRGSGDYNFEFIYQGGRFGAGLIQAWTAASDTGYTAKSLPSSPRFGLRADVTSGDRDPNNPNLQTFSAMFPKGNYFGEISQIGPYNHIDAHPLIEWHLPHRVTLTMECDFFWRQSLNDGIYGISGNLLRSGKNKKARYIGTQPSLHADWQVDSHLSFAANYTRFIAGAFLRETPPADDINFFTTWVTYKF